MVERARQAAVLLQAPAMGLVRRTVKDMIVEKLAALVATGVLQQGDDLPSERDLAAALSVSRETVRGAVQTLAGAGLVEIAHGARTRIVSTDVGRLGNGIVAPSRINRYDIDCVHGARLLVERAVAAEAAARIDDGTLARLEASLAQQRQAIDDPIRFLICDREFHLAIYRLSANALLCDFVADLYTYMLDYRRAAVSKPGAIRHSYDDHLAIVAALRARDPKATVAAFERHIERIYATTRSLLDEGARSNDA